MFSIRFRIVLASTLVFSTVLFITFYISLIDINNSELKIIDQQIRSHTLILSYQLEKNVFDIENYKRIINILNEEYGEVRAGLFSNKGKFIQKDSSILNLIPIELHWNEKFLKTGSCSDIEIDGNEFRCFSNKINIEGYGSALLVLAVSKKVLIHKYHAHYFFFFTLVPAFLLILSYVSYRLTKSAFKPVMNMIDSVKEITAARLDKRLDLPKSNDEIRTLGETLNSMISRIDDSFKSQKRFIADASHEIRTPLTIIQTELELAAQNSKEEDTKESIRISLSEIERLNSLTSSLLALARLDADSSSLNITSCRIDELLADCTALMQKAAAEKSIEIALNIDDPITAEIDSEKIRRALLNFIDNSIKYSEHEKKIEISLKTFDSFYEIRIADNGFGIPAEELPNIFKRFYRSNEIRSRIPGNGIGLSLAEEIIKLHNGTIQIESVLNKGTTAVIKLPARFNNAPDI